MAQAKPGDTVQVYYTGTLFGGEGSDALATRKFLQFIIGKRQIIPGFEEAIIGMKPGESKSIVVPADQAYGPYREELIQVVDRNQLPASLEPEVGERLEIHQQDGQTITARVTDVSGSSITWDANHPLAGKDLSFELELAGIL